MKAALLLLAALSIQAHAYPLQPEGACQFYKLGIDSYDKDQNTLTVREIIASNMAEGAVCEKVAPEDCLEAMNKDYKLNCIDDYKP